MLEQPGSSRASFYPRMEWLKRFSFRLYGVAWWARHYHALTPKRHRCWTNSPQAAVLDRGRLSKQQRDSCKVKTVNKKVIKDPNGKTKVSYSGNRNLKATQLEAQ